MAGLHKNNNDEMVALPPGFRFHPTDEELVTHYLSPKILNHSFTTKVIGDVDLNKVEPWDLPWKAKMGEKEWYFFCVRDRKYPTGSRTNRATESGYWKATGKDKEIFRGKILVGMKKTLVFYKGRAPRGEKTNWVIHEYRVEGTSFSSMHHLPKLVNKSEWVISRVFKKTSGGKKVHISGLLKSRGLEVDSPSAGLPPLTDISSEERTAAEGSHVTCFSNSVDGKLAGGELTPSSKNNNNNNSNLSYQPFQGYSSYYDSLLMQDQAIIRLLLENNGSCMKQNAKTEFLPAIGGVNDLPPFDDQEFAAATSDVDCFWNYSFLGDGLLE